MTRITWLYIGLVATTVGVKPGMINAAEPLTVIVMDPLSAPLSCDCVKGYAQRKYELLGAHLQRELKRPVRVFWSESLQRALDEQSAGKADLVIGKHSVVLFDAHKTGKRFLPVASLTDEEGEVVQTGLIVVRKQDAARAVTDLQGYRIYFGPEDCDEKWRSPRLLLSQHGIDFAGLAETAPSCSVAATRLMELDPAVRAAAVISSYAQPMLEGCGTIQKGDLRVIGESAPIEFITAFVSEALPVEERALLTSALLHAGETPEILIGLQTAEGFVPFKPVSTEAESTASEPRKRSDTRVRVKVDVNVQVNVNFGSWSSPFSGSASVTAAVSTGDGEDLKKKSR